MSSTADLFTDVVDSTPITFDTGPEAFINDVLGNQHVVSELVRGKMKMDMTRTGPTLKDRRYLEIGQTTQDYVPGQPVSVSNPNTGVNQTAHWAHILGQITWTEADEELNIDPASMTRKALKSHLKSVLALKELDTKTSCIEGLDDRVLAKPNAGTMEHTSSSADAAGMCSLAMFVNEEPNGLYAGYNDTNGDFTTKFGIDPTLYSNWDCERLAYDASSAGIASNSSDDGLLAILDLMHRRLKYNRPIKPFPEAGEETTESQMQIILTGEDGRSDLTKVYRQNGDNFVTPDPRDLSFGGITVGGNRLVEVRELDNVEWYDSGNSTLTTGANASSPGARYHFLNMKYLDLKVHGQKFWERRKTREPSDHVGFYWAPLVLWAQLWPSSLRRHGIVYPKAPATSSGSSSGA